MIEIGQEPKWINWGNNFVSRCGVFGATALFTIVSMIASTAITESVFLFYPTPENPLLRFLGAIIPLVVAPWLFLPVLAMLRHMSGVQHHLAAANEQFRDFADIASDWFWETDAEGRYTYISGKHQEKIGVPKENIIGRTREAFVENFETVDTDTNPEWRRVNDLIERRQPFDGFHYRVTRTDGRALVIESSGKPVIGPAGDFLGYRGIGRDVTESEHDRRLLIDAIEAFSPGFAMFDADDRLVLYNSHYREMVDNVAPNSLQIGRTFKELLTEWVASDVYKVPVAERADFVATRLAHHRAAPNQREHQLIDGR